MTPTHIPHGAAAPDDGGPPRALILSGGGMRVAYQAGVIRALLDAGLAFTHMDGTSGGSMNLSMLLSGISPREMCERWSTLRVRDFGSTHSFEVYLRPDRLMGLGSADGIVEKVFPHLGIDVAKIRAATGVQATYNVCNFSRKTVEVIPHDQIDLELIIAGMSLPMLMPPLLREGTYYTDAAWIKDANLLEAVRRGAEELWVVWCIGNTREFRGGAFNQYVHMLEMTANGHLIEELFQIEAINERIRAGETVLGHTRPIRLHLIRPQHGLPLDPDLFFGNVSPATLVEMGHADGVRYLREMRPEGLPLQPEVTQMSERVPAITFRETMAGAFALGATDPEAGARAGEEAGTRLSMHATVIVRDVEHFVRDPLHGGSLVGTIDFTPFGTGIPTGEGVFRLFSPAEESGMKLMVYELPFKHEGEDYYLAGRKEVRDDPGFDAWRDMTTLFTRLHRGTDAGGPVVAAGVLSLSVAEFTRVLASMHAVDTDSPIEAARLLAQFGRFFGGEVWESYQKLAGGKPVAT
jgi:predicted acylesterase/phospholipase RssA